MGVEHLAARVRGVNNANRYAVEVVYPQLVAVFTPLVGQKIEKVDGSLLAKYESLLPKFEDGNVLHVYRHRSNYSLAWVVKTCESVPPHGCTYHETVVYIGEMSNGVLTKICDPLKAKCNYTVEEVVEARKVHEAAKKKASDALSALHPFGEYDR